MGTAKHVPTVKRTLRLAVSAILNLLGLFQSSDLFISCSVLRSEGVKEMAPSFSLHSYNE